MAYTAGDTILDDEYNAFATNNSSPFGINHIIGTGDGVYGLGQSTISTVAAGNVITAAQWNSLFSAMDNVANHTEVSITSTTTKNAGDAIAAIAALTTDLASLATAVSTGSPNASSGLTAGSEDSSRVASAVFDTSHIVEESFTFVGGDEARWFFNAGGKIRISLSNNATNSTGKDTTVSTLATALGNFDIGATACSRSGSGETETTFASTTGYYDLTTSYTTLIELTEDSGSYSGNISIKIEAKTNSAHADGRNNNGTVITVKCSVLVDDGTTTDYTSGNTDGVQVEDEAAGTTDWSFRTVDPNTTQGLSTVYTNVTVANVSNLIDNAD
jgi:hypothetical protein